MSSGRHFLKVGSFPQLGKHQSFTHCKRNGKDVRDLLEWAGDGGIIERDTEKQLEVVTCRVKACDKIKRNSVRILLSDELRRVTVSTG